MNHGHSDAWDDSVNLILAHTSATLPDSLEQRKRLLQSVERLLSAEHPARPHVLAHLAAIDCLNSLQAQIHVEFCKLAPGSRLGESD